MPDRAGLTHPTDSPARPAQRTLDAVPEQGDVAGQRPSFHWTRPLNVGRVPGVAHRTYRGDLVEGIVAAAALLVMMAIGVTPWLAIPVSVVIYIAVAMLRPTGEGPVEKFDATAALQPDVEPMAEDLSDRALSHGTLAGVDAVVARFALTRREAEILPLLDQRFTDREIAEHLSISHRTAMNHTANILHKLGLASRRDVTGFVALHALPPPREHE